MTNRDKKDSIRDRMADTGEPFNVARRKTEAAGQVPENKDPYHLIEVEVGSDRKRADLPPSPRHIETFWGRWIIEPDPEKLHSPKPGVHKAFYYGVAETRRGRIAVYKGTANPAWEEDVKDYLWEGELDDYGTLADAEMPEDIRRQVAAALGIREVIHRDI